MPVSSHSTETRQARQKGTIKLCGMSKAPRPSYLVYVSRVMPRSKAILSIGYLAAVRACRTRAANAARYCLGVTRRLLGVATAAPLRVLDIVYDPNPRWHTMLLRSLLASSSGTDVQAASSGTKLGHVRPDSGPPQASLDLWLLPTRIEPLPKRKNAMTHRFLVERPDAA